LLEQHIMIFGNNYLWSNWSPSESSKERSQDAFVNKRNWAHTPTHTPTHTPKDTHIHVLFQSFSYITLMQETAWLRHPEPILWSPFSLAYWGIHSFITMLSWWPACQERWIMWEESTGLEEDHCVCASVLSVFVDRRCCCLTPFLSAVSHKLNPHTSSNKHTYSIIDLIHKFSRLHDNLLTNRFDRQHKGHMTKRNSHRHQSTSFQ